MDSEPLEELQILGNLHHRNPHLGHHSRMAILSSSTTNRWLYPSFSMYVWLGHSCLKQEKGSRCLRANAQESSSISTGSTKPRTMYRARLKVLRMDMNLFLPLLNIGWCHGLATSHGITASVIPLCKGLLKADTSWSDNIKEWADMTMLELLQYLRD